MRKEQNWLFELFTVGQVYKVRSSLLPVGVMHWQPTVKARCWRMDQVGLLGMMCEGEWFSVWQSARRLAWGGRVRQAKSRSG